MNRLVEKRGVLSEGVCYIWLKQFNANGALITSVIGPHEYIGEELVILYRCDSRLPNSNVVMEPAAGAGAARTPLPDNTTWIAFFTLRRSEPRFDGSFLFELYDFARNTSFNRTNQTTKGKAMGYLKTFLEKVLLDKYPRSKLWLGTVESKLKNAYEAKGFHLLGDNHTVSPLGVPFPPGRPGSSFLFPLALSHGETLEVTSRELQNKLKGPVEIEISLPASYVREIYTNLVKKFKVETGMVFATLKTDKHPSSILRWTGTNFSCSDIDATWVKSPNSKQHPNGSFTVPMFSGLFVRHAPFNITGHTHPEYLYALLSAGKPPTEHQDLSPPSYADLNLVLYHKSPLHVVWSPEGVYSLQVPLDARKSGVDLTLTVKYVEHKEKTLKLKSLLRASPVICEQVIQEIYDKGLDQGIVRVVAPETDASGALTVSLNSEEYIRYKTFKVNLYVAIMNSNLVYIRGTESEPTVTTLQVCILKFHMYSSPLEESFQSLLPPLTCITDTPDTLLMTNDSIREGETLVKQVIAAHAQIPTMFVTSEMPLAFVNTFHKAGYQHPCKGNCSFSSAAAAAAAAGAGAGAPNENARMPNAAGSGAPNENARMPNAVDTIQFNIHANNDLNEYLGVLRFPNNTSIHTILLNVISKLVPFVPTEGEAGKGHLVSNIRMVPAVPLFLRNPNGEHWKINYYTITGYNTSCHLTANSTRPDGNTVSQEIDYPFTSRILVEALQTAIVTTTLPAGGGKRRRKTTCRLCKSSKKTKKHSK